MITVLLPGSQLSPMGRLEVKGRGEPLDAFVLRGSTTVDRHRADTWGVAAAG